MPMIDKIEAHLKAVKQFEETTPEAIEVFRIKYAGKKGVLNDLFAAFREVKNEEKKACGQVLNQLKTAVSEKVEALKSASADGEKVSSGLDLSRPGYPVIIGNQHPLTLVKNRIIEIFNQIGYNISEGPEIEDDWHNFTALNLP